MWNNSTSLTGISSIAYEARLSSRLAAVCFALSTILVTSVEPTSDSSASFAQRRFKGVVIGERRNEAQFPGLTGTRPLSKIRLTAYFIASSLALSAVLAIITNERKQLSVFSILR